MAIEIGAFEAKTQLSKLLERVRRGESFTITKHGVPVARLVPPGNGVDVREAVQTLRSIRRRTQEGPETLQELIGEGRRH